MEVTNVQRQCDKCEKTEDRDPLYNERELLNAWPFHPHGEKDYNFNFRRQLRCAECEHEEEENIKQGLAPLDFLPGSRETRVFVGGNYEQMATCRDIRNAVFATGPALHPVLPYDDYQIPQGQVYDTDLRLLHNCAYAIFDVSVPAGQLFEIARAAEYKVQTLIVFQPKEGDEPPISRTMILESGEHEYRRFRDNDHLRAIVKDFLVGKDHQEWERAVEAIGYHFETCQSKQKILADGTANHEYSFDGLTVDVEAFELPQLTHTFNFSSGEVLEDFGPPSGNGASWTSTRSTRHERFGVVHFDQSLKKDDKISYSISMKTKGAFVLSRSELENVPREELDNDPLLAAGYEYTSRTTVHPARTLVLSTEFPDGYPVTPSPAAFLGGERRDDGLRIPPDSFAFENNIAILTINEPKLHYRYAIIWEIPELPTAA